MRKLAMWLMFALVFSNLVWAVAYGLLEASYIDFMVRNVQVTTGIQ